jgi:hypothetical protein
MDYVNERRIKGNGILRDLNKNEICRTSHEQRRLTPLECIQVKESPFRRLGDAQR